MVRFLLISLFFIGCTRFHNNHNEDVLDCGPELTRGQDYFTVVSSQGIRLVSGFEVIDLNSGRPENLVTSKGCVVKKAEGRFLIRSTGTDDAQIIDMREYEKYSRVELSDYSGQSVSIACKDDVQTVSNAFTIQSILQTNLQPNLRAAIQLEYAFSSPKRPGAAFNLTQASQALPLRGEIDERIYELRVVVSNLLRMGKVEATCRFQLDRTPPEVFVSVNSKRPEEMIEVHGTANIVPVGLIDSISFLASKNDGVTVYYCLVPLDDDFDSANMEARKIWKSRTESKNCDDSKRLISPLGSAIASDVKAGFWSIKFQSSDAVGNVSSPQNQTILVLNKDYHRLIRENVLASLGSKSSRRVVDSALRAEVLRNNLPTRYERDLEKDTALSGLLRAYYQETVSIEINAHHSSVRAIALSEDGQVLVSSSFDRTLKLWNVDTGQNIWSVNSEVFSNIAISPDRKYIVGIDQTGSILAFDAMDGRYLRVIKARDRSALVSTQIQFGPDSQSVLINSGNDIEIRSIESGEILRALKGHAKSVKDFSVVPGGEMVVSVAADKTLRFWDFETGLNLKIPIKSQ